MIVIDCEILQRLDASASHIDPFNCDVGLMALVVDLANHLLGDPDIEPNGDELDSSFGHDEREHCASDDGDITWKETHGFGDVQDWAYDYSKWNTCTPLSEVSA
ncbi:hypothetical protein [Ahrensia sp. 13_GOM-1096m]|uniref:hypothetical protein n=1 Tax=Ahrensia sp. 13_GOM-1096m TaxID=1380380 RepID=UPI00047D6579|nr:hypothetical protein [Ahrensia sp. 13_GOM-1096m]